MEQKAETSDNSLYVFFNGVPFIFISPEVKLTPEIVYNIYEKSNFFSKSLENFRILEQEYKIIFEDEDENNVNIYFYKNDMLVEIQMHIMKTPNIIYFENLDEMKDKKVAYIFIDQAYSGLIYFLDSKNDKYEYTEDKINKTLLIKRKSNIIDEEIYKLCLEKNNNIKNLEEFNEKTIKINPKCLSSNFYTIFQAVKENKDFIFILNKERIEFFNKLNGFINSGKLFYYITGSDGIGKSLSLLYYSSLHKQKFLYFNMKLYQKYEGDKVKFHKFFYNDLHKFFLYDYPKKNNLVINIEFDSYIKRFGEMVKSQSINDIKDIKTIYKYILGILNTSPGNAYTIILDQYKSDLSDPDYSGLNELVKFIITHKDRNKIKLIISSSVDNTSNKYVLLRNLSNIYLDLEPHNLSKLVLEESLDNINSSSGENTTSNSRIITEIEDVLENKNDCDFCEKVFKKERERRNKELQKENDNYSYTLGSKCLIDNYLEYTTKDYFFALTNGKGIFENIMSENELVMAEIFNYNLKYINKYLSLKSQTKKTQGEKESSFEKRVINLLYEEVSDKMKKNITQFYESFYIENKNKIDKQYINSTHLQFQSLCKLRNYIFYDKKFIIKDLAQQLLIFPMKYLQIVVNDYDGFSFPQKGMQLDYSFKLEYSNNFVRIIINKMIEEVFKSITSVGINSLNGSAEGIFLEIKINELFRNTHSHPFNLEELECRYLFSLVSKTENSDVTIKKHREEEAKLYFFGKNNYSSILIDDIDVDEIKKTKKGHYKLNKKYYYFSQISLIGKAFDMCVIVYEEGNKYKLYLFQVSKSKLEELRTKIYYLIEADNVAKNLERLYNINITSRYLIFILPKINYNSQFLENLKKNNFCSIFFDIDTNEFYNDKEEKINSFDFPGSVLDITLKKEDSDFNKINGNYLIWKYSLKEFINKKRNNKQTFHNLYINKFYNTNNFKLMKLDITKINNLILKKINAQNAILKFIGNCEVKNRNYIRNIQKMVFIFKKDETIYVDYGEIYKLITDKSKYSLEIVEGKDFDSKGIKLNETPLKVIQTQAKKYNTIKLSDLSDEKVKYNNICFCYLVVTEDFLTRFYNWWC